MKNKFTLLLSFLAILTFKASEAQDIYSKYQSGITPLKIGDQVPDIAIANIYNYKKDHASTADFKDGLLILDFGDIYCKGCVEELPHMDSLNKKFKEKANILWVTANTRAAMQTFWTHNKYVKSLKIPVVVADSTLRAYFRFSMWPHEAWIYNGKVIALTAPEYVSAEHIQMVLNNEKIDWPIKDDFNIFDGNKTPLFAPDSNQVAPGGIIKYAAISDYKEGATKINTSDLGIVRDSSTKTIRAFFLNFGIYDLYMYVKIQLGTVNISKFAAMKPADIDWRVFDMNKYNFTEGKGYRSDWTRENGICFESLNPDTGQSDKQVYQSVENDLNRLLGLSVRWEGNKLIFEEINGGMLIDAKGQVDIMAKIAAQKNMENPKPEDNKQFLENNKTQPGVVTLPSGLQYKIVKQGTGALPSATDKVKVNYTGTLVNGKIFDSSYKNGLPITFGVDGVIAGWTEALQRMPVGSKWILYIPAELAYGPHTNQGAVPPNSAMIFEIELLSIIK